MSTLKYPAFCVALMLISLSGNAQNRVDMRKPTAGSSNYAFAEIDTVYRNRNGYRAATCEMDSAAVFQGVTFLANADFTFVNFRRNATFAWSNFGKAAEFTQDSFCNGADFSKATFQSGVNFSKAVVNNVFSARMGIFRANADFNMASFRDGADFGAADFREGALFSQVIFNKRANFRGANMKRTIDFSGAIFRDDADFAHMVSDSSHILFNATRLPYSHIFDLSYNVSLGTDIDLTAADFSEAGCYQYNSRQWHYLNVFKSDVQRIKFDYEHFRLCFYSEKAQRDFEIDPFAGNDRDIVDRLWGNGRFRAYLFRVFPSGKYPQCDGFYSTLYTEVARFFKQDVFHATPPLRDSIIRHFILDHIGRGYFPAALPDEDEMALYESVLKNFKDYGQEISYERLDIEYHDLKNGANIFPHIWNCYGYHKEWPFIWALLFIAFFTIVTFFFLPFLDGNVYKISFITISDIEFGSPESRSGSLSPGIRVTNKQQINKSPRSAVIRRIRSRVWYSFIYTVLIFAQFTKAWESLNFEGKWIHVLGTLYILIIWITGIACIAYAAAFVLH